MKIKLNVLIIIVAVVAALFGGTKMYQRHFYCHKMAVYYEERAAFHTQMAEHYHNLAERKSKLLRKLSKNSDLSISQYSTQTNRKRANDLVFANELGDQISKNREQATWDEVEAGRMAGLAAKFRLAGSRPWSRIPNNN